VLLISAFSACPAVAGGDTGEERADPVWDEISNYRGWKIGSFSIRGPERQVAKELEKGLELSGKDAVLYENSLKRDIERIGLFMALRGYPYSGISPSISANSDKRTVRLLLRVDPGPPVLVEDTDVSGMPDELMSEALDVIRMRKDAVFRDAALAEDKQDLLEILEEAGHARARISTDVSMTDTARVRVRFDVAAGEVYYFDRFSASGASEDLNELALTAINIRKGERYHISAIRDARDNLSSLQLFRQIRISLENTAPDSLEVVVELSEKKHRTLEIAAGYWSDEGLSARARWKHTNLFRKGRGSSFEISYTRYKQSGRWISWWPALFKARLVGTIRIGYDNIDEDSYDKTSPNIGLGLSYSHTRRMQSSIGYVIERARYNIKTDERDTFDDPKGPVGYFTYRIVRDGTDDRLNPVKGTYSWLRLEYSPAGGVSNSNYLLAEASGTLHVPVTSRVVIATNVHLGSGFPISPSNSLLPDKRFYPGGSTSHRGFERQRLGPLDGSGLPLGGELAMTGFVEVRFPLVWKLNGAVFLDAGQAWRTRGDFTWDNIELAAGPAVRIMTPVGPLRFALGYKLTEYEPDLPGFVFHFAIGYPM